LDKNLMQNQISARIAPMLPADWGVAEHDAMGSAPSARDFVLTNWQKDPRGVHGLGVMLRHPLATKAFLAFNNHVSVASSISKRVRELLILRLSWLRCSEYEFAQHVVLGRRYGLSDADIERLQRGPDTPGWDALDADLVRAVDELHANACIGDGTWARLSCAFSTEQLIDIIYTVGCYEIAAMMFKTLGAQLEAGVEAISAEARTRMYAGKTSA
jgi:4-carboxymuconolactone decarboxylase